MPWEHCGQQVTDDEACPECGASKGTWTIRHSVTRTFMLRAPAAAGQAEALQDAADAGSAFCEDCQAADDAEPPVEDGAEEEAPPSDPDEEAQVDTLQTAADSGAPFCEECQQTDNEAA